MLVRLFALLAACVSHSFAHASPAPDWSIVVYAGLDEEEIAQYGDPAVAEFLRVRPPSNVELLIETDTHEPSGVTRVIRRSGHSTVKERLPEHDSASPEAFESFIAWASHNTRGKHVLFLVMTHSWGWKGIIQDYTVPGRPGDDTMMPLAAFAHALKNFARPIDVLFLDSCVLGNVEPMAELANTAHYVVASQRETPYSGYPYPELYSLLKKTSEPREVAKAIPEQYVRAFSRGGSRVKSEGEYDIVTAVALDLTKWDAFERRFRTLTTELANTAFRARLAEHPEWPAAIWDEDHNVDLIEMTKRLPESAAARAVLEFLGYPKDADERSRRSYSYSPEDVSRVRVRIPVDENLKSDAILKTMTARWRAANQDLPEPESIHYSQSAGTFIVDATIRNQPYAFRPWLAGTPHVSLSTLRHNGQWVRETMESQFDFIATTDFPVESLLVAEAHTYGAPFIHGLGVCFNPTMDEQEERGTDSATGLSGPAFYRATHWNQATGWGDLVLLK